PSPAIPPKRSIRTAPTSGPMGSTTRAKSCPTKISSITAAWSSPFARTWDSEPPSWPRQRGSIPIGSSGERATTRANETRKPEAQPGFGADDRKIHRAATNVRDWLLASDLRALEPRLRADAGGDGRDQSGFPDAFAFG